LNPRLQGDTRARRIDDRLAGPCPSLTGDKQATGLRPAIDSKRADENTTVFFTYCGSARRIFHFHWHVLVLGATLPEKSP
jgi:hypothetical protein